MSFVVRDLYAVAGMSRPDIPQVQYGVALQRAVKRVCQETLLARTTLQYSITADTNSVLLAVTNGEPLMVHHVLWKGATDTDYTPLVPTSFGVAHQNEMWEWTGKPCTYSQQGSVLILYPTPTEAGELLVTLSYFPSVDVDTAPLPGWARPAVEAAAEVLLLKIPGPGQSLSSARMLERDLRGMLQDLKAKSLFGESGEIIASVPVNPYGTE